MNLTSERPPAVTSYRDTAISLDGRGHRFLGGLEVVEVMGNAAGEATDALHLLGLAEVVLAAAQRGLGLAALGKVRE
jgi:hypothetical protein